MLFDMLLVDDADHVCCRWEGLKLYTIQTMLNGLQLSTRYRIEIKNHAAQ